MIVACSALTAAIISLWCRPNWLWLAVSALTIVASYSAGVMYGPAVLWLAMLGAALFFYRRSKHTAIRCVALVVFCAIALLLGLHVAPGFNNPLLTQNTVLSPGAAPYTLYFNFDKPFVGILILGTASMLLLKPDVTWRVAMSRALPIIFVNVLAAMLLALSLGEIEFQPRWNSFFWTWAAMNLLFTCMSEEAFFRAFIQREVRVAARNSRHAGAIAVAISALIFGLAHFSGGWPYIVVATLAGVGYALVYERTQRIELAIAAHFILNATHFLLFTYPRVASP